MGTDYDHTFDFRVTFASLGAFPVTIQVYDLGTAPETLLTSYSTTVNVVEPFVVTDIALSYSTDKSEWLPVPGSYDLGFEMRLEQTEAWYYMDAASITANRPVANGFYPFYFDVASLPDGFYQYWEGRNVFDGTTGVWEPLMWDIISGVAPIFYLEVDGGSLMLVDGLLYAIDGTKEFLRFEGTYWPGIYTFVGSVADEYDLEEELAVQILLNDRPLTNPQSFTTSEDVPIDFVLEVVDYYPGEITFKYTDFPDHGELIVTNAPNFTYVPDENWNGTDSFSYRAFDGIAYSRFTTITITVEPVNDPPVAVDQTLYTDIDTPLSIVLEVINVDEDTLLYSYLDLPDNGSIGGVEPDIVYTPYSGFVGSDSFVFQVTDGEYTDSATISINVIEPGDFECYLPLIVQ